MTMVICGQGRLGSRVAALLAARQQPLKALRIDRERGLINPDGPVPADIDCLLLCLVPRHPDGGSGWTGLLQGLQAQVARGDLRLQRVLLVSSTAVYESYDHGWVTASSPVSAVSARSAGLIEAEQIVRMLTTASCVVRLAGITGPGYERYDPIAMSQHQARHAIDVRAAAQLIAELALQPTSAARTELITDGYVYFQQQRYPAEPTLPALAALATQQRLMQPTLPAPAAS